MGIAWPFAVLSLLAWPSDGEISYDGLYHSLLRRIFKVKSFLLGSALLSYCSFKSCSFIHDYYFNKLEKNVTIEFIQNWERNKKHTPAKLQGFFEELYNDYTKNPDSIMADLGQIIKKIKEEIMKHDHKK